MSSSSGAPPNSVSRHYQPLAGETAWPPLWSATPSGKETSHSTISILFVCCSVLLSCLFLLTWFILCLYVFTVLFQQYSANLSVWAGRHRHRVPGARSLKQPDVTSTATRIARARMYTYIYIYIYIHIYACVYIYIYI